MTVKEFFEVFGEVEINAPRPLYKGYRSIEKKLLDIDDDYFNLEEVEIEIERYGNVYKTFESLEDLLNDNEVLKMEVAKIKAFNIDYWTQKSSGNYKYNYNASTITIIVK